MLYFDDILAGLTNGHTPTNHDFSQGEVLFLTAENISDFTIEYGTDKRILHQHHQGELARTALRDGDVLLTIKGKVGNAAYVECPEKPVNINQDVALLRFKSEYFSYYFISYINSFLGKTFIEQLCTSQINPFLSLGNIRQIPVPIYETAVMKRIALRTEESVSKGRQAALDSNNLLNDARKIIEGAILNCEKV